MFFFVFLVSCCYKGNVSEYNKIRTKLNKNIDGVEIYKIIDTLAIYELVGYYIDNNYIYFDYSFGENFLKFYPNGKVGSFINVGNGKDHTYIKEDFNPKKARMGYFFYDKKKIKARVMVYNQCNKAILRCEISVVKDTLILKYNNASIRNMKDVYVKKQIPKEFLEGWQPDW